MFLSLLSVITAGGRAEHTNTHVQSRPQGVLGTINKRPMYLTDDCRREGDRTYSQCLVTAFRSQIDDVPNE